MTDKAPDFTQLGKDLKAARKWLRKNRGQAAPDVLGKDEVELAFVWQELKYLYDEINNRPSPLEREMPWK